MAGIWAHGKAEDAITSNSLTNHTFPQRSKEHE